MPDVPLHINSLPSFPCLDSAPNSQVPAVAASNGQGQINTSIGNREALRRSPSSKREIPKV